MDTSKIAQRVIFLLSWHNVSSLTMQTEDVVTFSQEDDSIILNCTYQIGYMEDISNRNIRWQKQVGDEFKDIAIFSPPGGQNPFIQGNMQLFNNNRIELIEHNTTLAAVMIIKDPSCVDEGTYRCWIEFFSENVLKTNTSLSSVIINAKARKPKEFLVFPTQLEENQSISLTCGADVGSPGGYIQIWKVYHNSSELIRSFHSTDNETKQCTKYINVTTTYTVSREDNGASFRCSSQNNLTQGSGPNQESQKISVLYGPDKPTVTLMPPQSAFFEGDRLTIQCSTDSNPSPRFVWRFQPHNKTEETPIRSSSKSNLVFDYLQSTDSGTYICTAVNENRSNSPNATSYEAISVRNSERKYTCDQCGYTDTCQLNNGKTSCTPNPWVPVAAVFIFLSATFAVSTILIWQRKRRQKSDSASRTVVSQRSPSSNAIPEDTHGVYSSPNDLIRMQENSSLLTHHTEADGYTTTGDVVQYAAVQKRTTEDNQVPDDKVYDSAWN